MFLSSEPCRADGIRHVIHILHAPIQVFVAVACAIGVIGMTLMDTLDQAVLAEKKSFCRAGRSRRVYGRRRRDRRRLRRWRRCLISSRLSRLAKVLLFALACTYPRSAKVAETPSIRSVIYGSIAARVIANVSSTSLLLTY